ncbi:MAG: hypothetical protein LIP09_01750 [Bacteroidales bacterium]|nr:hypothetical protein [Bacteroidales bacterium]
MKKSLVTLALCLVSAVASMAETTDIPMFPRSFGYSSKGDADTQTITFDKGYAQYGYKNKGQIDLSAYTNIVLEIEPTDSRVEIQIIYDNDGEDQKLKLGQINAGKTAATVEYDGMRPIKAIFLTKSKPGEVKVKKFQLTDGE